MFGIMRELSMFYKMRNILLVILSCVLAFPAGALKAQGLVSLSEEAMFDDGLDTGDELPDLGQPAKPTDADHSKAPADDTAEIPLIQPKAAPAPVTAPKPAAAPAIPTPPATTAASGGDAAINLFGNSAEEEDFSNSDLFTQMSDLEKRTALLNLELRREKLQNEIEAVKNQRRQALQQEKDKIEQQRLKNIEFEKEQEQKVLVEQQKLRDLDIQFETLRQEKLLGSYKNYMLEEVQKWIANNGQFYKQIDELRQSKRDLTANMKAKMKAVQDAARQAQQDYTLKVNGYTKEIKDLRAQINVLRKRIASMEKEQEAMLQNPFANAEPQAQNVTTMVSDDISADDSVTKEPVETDLSKLYAVTEIRGQGGELIAKLINKNGTAFYVKRGTALQTGHVITDITSTFVAAEKDGEKKYLYFSAGGIIPVETTKFELDAGAVPAAATTENNTSGGPVGGSL